MNRKPLRLLGVFFAASLLLALTFGVLPVLAQSSKPAPHPGDLLSDATGYGPGRGDATENTPRHTPSLFDEHACPAGGCESVPGELLVKFKPDMILVAPKDRRPTADVDSLNALFQAQDVKEAVRIFPAARRPRPGMTKQVDGVERPIPDLSRWYRLLLPEDANVLEAMTAFAADPNVEYAEPNYIYAFDGVPDDPSFDQQWHLHNTGQYYLADADIDAPEAWDIVTGTAAAIIAIIDTGIDRDHPDLDNHIWSNPGETPNNGVDDDGNGYVDDTWGWNWVSDYPTDPDDFRPNEPRDDNGHGTHVAGIAAAETNNGTGVAGVCWNCQVMSLKAFETNGTGTTSDIVQAINYAVNKGADVVNMSFGSYAHSQLVEDTLADAYGRALLVAAAGNGIRGKGTNQPFYPAAVSYVMGVGASDVQCVQRDPITLACLLVAEAKAPFSNYGVNSDVCAPGVSIYSTYPGGYASMAGTSMAAPVVSGLAGLMMAHFPAWSKESFRGQIINTTDAIYSDLQNFPACGSGRVNAYNAVTVLPVPSLTLLTASIEYGDATGDSDGIPDAGESVTVTMLLKDYWGEATDVTGTLSTADPYVTLLDTVGSWGDISAYATMRNTADPFAFSLNPIAPNNHQVELTLDLISNGGSYTAQMHFSFLVQRGVEIPSALFPGIITQSMTLYSDYLYIVKQNMLVAQGVTLTIEPGTRLQFDPGKFIKIQGTLIASGTADLPIYFTSNQKDPQPGDFGHIYFAPGSESAVWVGDSYAGGSILNHVVLEYSDGLLLIDSSPYIVNSVFRHNTGVVPPGSTNGPSGAIGVFGTISPALRIENCTISDNSISGIFLYANGGGNIDIRNNLIQSNQASGGWGPAMGGGILVDGYNQANVVIRENNISYNTSPELGGGIGLESPATVEGEIALYAMRLKVEGEGSLSAGVVKFDLM